MKPLIPRMLEMYYEAKASHRWLAQWRLSPDLWERFHNPPGPELGGTIMGIPVEMDSSLPPNSVVLL